MVHIRLCTANFKVLLTGKLASEIPIFLVANLGEMTTILKMLIDLPSGAGQQDARASLANAAAFLKSNAVREWQHVRQGFIEKAKRAFQLAPRQLCKLAYQQLAHE